MSGPGTLLVALNLADRAAIVNLKTKKATRDEEFRILEGEPFYRGGCPFLGVGPRSGLAS